jgi:hypothetical protein
MTHPRINGSAVLLPDGEVLVLGGHNQFKFERTSTPSLAAEIYDPVGNSWHSAGTTTNVPRMYHSAHLLLPDGRVLCAGGNDPNHPGDPNRKSFQFYEPPYFFNPDDSLAARPTITGISRDDGPDDQLAYGREFFIQTPNAGWLSPGWKFWRTRRAHPTPSASVHTRKRLPRYRLRLKIVSLTHDSFRFVR